MNAVRKDLVERCLTFLVVCVVCVGVDGICEGILVVTEDIEEEWRINEEEEERSSEPEEEGRMTSSSSSSSPGRVSEGSEDARSSVMGVMTGEGGNGDGSFHLCPTVSLVSIPAKGFNEKDTRRVEEREREREREREEVGRTRK